ncbi:hypothetical protein [Bacteriophage Phobos]|uniref:Uncharacterized protein n=1 Tax=Bacteriophage Phobos TaxID=2662138 RepID=A0A5Q2UAE0_9CAUD|nr:hypothetical protein JT319_gp44 [Bacteriophage Phobos]QGH45012.1 hypothetical protein [Bacteriophage Phobos]WPK42410.1 hypothetical protein [Pseudomonas phage Ppu-503]
MAATPKQRNVNIASREFIARPKPAGKRAPLLSFAEAAKEFGVSETSLRGMMCRQNPAPPQPEFKHRSGSYYHAQQFRDWFKKAKAAHEEAARG